MGQLERSPDSRLQACFLFFLSASLVIQTAYLLYHLWGLLTLGLERFQGKSTDAKHRQVRSWLAAGFGWEPMLNYVFWDIFNELIRFLLLYGALFGDAHNLPFFCLFFFVLLTHFWRGPPNELLEHLYETCALKGIARRRDVTRRLMIRLLSGKSLLYHVAFLCGVLLFGNYLYLNYDFFFNYGLIPGIE